ncbi:TIGR03767 family metallophosphoesterase [Embleya hyalina]|uniref:Metallophosphoesterase n=1 Tax=Embleya hyalina TaxID=516124 RepID=A0A401YIM3_9ACTN|nr:TIGR03767 family metallophosphoesterase [Embleya hyalina]GCD94450.1 metallophosphoesterase [Embleya hyalina]
MKPNRRDVLKYSAASAALLGVAACSDDDKDKPDGKSSDTPKSGAPKPAGAAGTTLERTLVLGPPGPGGYRKVVAGPGEPHLLRSELVPGGGSGDKAKRRSLVAFTQLTDIHIQDAQSTARVDFLDRHSDKDQPFAKLLPFQSAYRPQEVLTAQIAEAMVQSLNRIGKGPALGAPLAFTICTGDNTDNIQFNELRWYIDVLDGGRKVTPDSGDRNRYEGPMDAVAYHERYWHPDGTPPGQKDDVPRAQYGYPTVPGLLDACRRPFDATGLKTPWYSAYGNHDGLVQGNLPVSELLGKVAVGDEKVLDISPGQTVVALALGLQSGKPDALAALLAGPKRKVTADPDRRLVDRAETIREHFNTTGLPKGHGFTQQNLDTKTAYYTFDQGPVRCLVLDTVNSYGSDSGCLDPTQFAWLEDQLVKGSSSHLDERGGVVRGTGQDRLFVLFSHHTIETMTNKTVPAGEPARILGPQVLALLLRFPNVVLWVNGHTHDNKVKPYPRPAGSAVPGGFWEINTASHIDWPSQARIVEIADNANGTLSIFGTIIDSAGPESHGNKLDSPLALAALARELAGNDWQERDRPDPKVDGRRGRLEDRNVELLVPAPFSPSGA